MVVVYKSLQMHSKLSIVSSKNYFCRCVMTLTSENPSVSTRYTLKFYCVSCLISRKTAMKKTALFKLASF
jgi:hypothetical protein